MRKILAVLAFLIVNTTALMAQDVVGNNNNSVPAIQKFSRDFLMLQVNYNNWAKKPDSVKTKGFGYNFKGYVCYDFPIKKTNLSFAAGIGIDVNVVYFSGQVMANKDTGVLGDQVRFIPDTANYKRYKFVTSYLQAPFELRYFANKLNRNKGFKAAIGVEVGTLLGAHTKGLTSVDGTNIKIKENTKRYLSPWNFAATARVGYGNFALCASYNLTNVFKETDGPPITPFSIGLCITGL